MTRPYEQREARYLAEYVAQRFQDWQHNFRVRVGPKAEGITTPAAKWVDYIAVKDNEVFLVEAKFDKPSAGVGQLLVYRDLLPSTPGWEWTKNAEVQMILVTPVKDADVTNAARNLGVEVVIWRPDELLTELARGSSL